MLDLFHDLHWLIPTSVFIGGFLGSPHCVSMCGPLVLNFSRRTSHLICYQLGRLISYSLAGAIVGHFGREVFGLESPPWLSLVATVSLAALLVINGVRLFSRPQSHMKLPIPLERLLSRLWSALRSNSLPPTATAAMAGGLTALLPCAHLYTFLLGAVATGSAGHGAAYMFAFWLGSTPVLSVGGRWIQGLLHVDDRRKRALAGVIVICAGIASLASFAANVHFHGTGTQPAAQAVRCH